MFGNISFPTKISQPFKGNGSKAMYTSPTSNQPTSKANAFQEFEKHKTDAFNRVYDHELKHQQTGGAQAGSIVINFDGNGVATSGHVSIQVPSSVDSQNPTETLQKAETAFNAAMAPSDPSSADLAVASMAQSIMSTASNAVGKKEAGSANANGKESGDANAKGNKLDMLA